MWKRALLAAVAVFVAWSALDFVIHEVILSSSYAATAELWRPREEMKMGLISLTTLFGAGCFVGIYTGLIQPKTLRSGALYRVLFGVAAGVSMGYGMYSVMPIPYHMALAWFSGATVEGVVAGLLAAWIVRP